MPIWARIFYNKLDRKRLGPKMNEIDEFSDLKHSKTTQSIYKNTDLAIIMIEKLTQIDQIVERIFWILFWQKFSKGKKMKTENFS